MPWTTLATSGHVPDTRELASFLHESKPIMRHLQLLVIQKLGKRKPNEVPRTTLVTPGCILNTPGEVANFRLEPKHIMRHFKILGIQKLGKRKSYQVPRSTHHLPPCPMHMFRKPLRSELK